MSSTRSAKKNKARRRLGTTEWSSETCFKRTGHRRFLHKGLSRELKGTEDWAIHWGKGIPGRGNKYRSPDRLNVKLLSALGVVGT